MSEDEYQSGLKALQNEWGRLDPDPQSPGILRAAFDPMTGILVGMRAKLVAEIINRALAAQLDRLSDDGEVTEAMIEAGRKVYDQIQSDETFRRIFIAMRNVNLADIVGRCESCRAPLYDQDDFTTDENGCAGCWATMAEGVAGRPCYAERVGKADANLPALDAMGALAAIEKSAFIAVTSETYETMLVALQSIEDIARCAQGYASSRPNQSTKGDKN